MKRPLPIRAIAAQTLATLRRGGASLTELLMEADARIDVYAVGLVMYELLSWIEKRTTGWAHRGSQGE